MRPSSSRIKIPSLDEYKELVSSFHSGIRTALESLRQEVPGCVRSRDGFGQSSNLTVEQIFPLETRGGETSAGRSERLEDNNFFDNLPPLITIRNPFEDPEKQIAERMGVIEEPIRSRRYRAPESPKTIAAKTKPTKADPVVGILTFDPRIKFLVDNNAIVQLEEYVADVGTPNIVIYGGEYSASISKLNSSGLLINMLSYAIKEDKNDIALMLVGKGASLEAAVSDTIENKYPALVMAVKLDKIDFIREAARIKRPSEWSANIKQMMLSYAFQYSSIEMVNYLLSDEIGCTIGTSSARASVSESGPAAGGGGRGGGGGGGGSGSAAESASEPTPGSEKRTSLLSNMLMSTQVPTTVLAASEDFTYDHSEKLPLIMRNLSSFSSKQISYALYLACVHGKFDNASTLLDNLSSETVSDLDSKNLADAIRKVIENQVESNSINHSKGKELVVGLLGKLTLDKKKEVLTLMLNNNLGERRLSYQTLPNCKVYFETLHLVLTEAENCGAFTAARNAKAREDYKDRHMTNGRLISVLAYNIEELIRGTFQRTIGSDPGEIDSLRFSCLCKIRDIVTLLRNNKYPLMAKENWDSNRKTLIDNILRLSDHEISTGNLDLILLKISNGTPFMSSYLGSSSSRGLYDTVGMLTTIIHPERPASGGGSLGSIPSSTSSSLTTAAASASAASAAVPTGPLSPSSSVLVASSSPSLSKETPSTPSSSASSAVRGGGGLGSTHSSTSSSLTTAAASASAASAAVPTGPLSPLAESERRDAHKQVHDTNLKKVDYPINANISISQTVLNALMELLERLIQFFRGNNRG